MILYVRTWNVRVEKILRYKIELNFLQDKFLFFYIFYFILLLFNFWISFHENRRRKHTRFGM